MCRSGVFKLWVVTLKDVASVSKKKTTAQKRKINYYNSYDTKIKILLLLR